jgi:alkylation response protein AidB-like acyl-CoA dehydrogenase
MISFSPTEEQQMIVSMAKQFATDEMCTIYRQCEENGEIPDHVIDTAWKMGQAQPNNLEASMAKAKAGLAVTKITQRAVEIMGPLGYSRKYLLEKWMRDAKINDIFEGTGQINMLIVARRVLDYSRDQLK